MILDPSAVLTIIFGEPGHEDVSGAIGSDHVLRFSAASLLEASIVAETRKNDTGVRWLDEFLRRAKVVIEPVTEEQALIARQAYSEYGKGRHPAGLNFGDCFSYALSKATG
ncbi:MAG: type II toxin-antitoxin system VapC family toxin, partial [Candidatus Acidiferrum sp.]